MVLNCVSGVILKQRYDASALDTGFTLLAKSRGIWTLTPQGLSLPHELYLSADCFQAEAGCGRPSAQ